MAERERGEVVKRIYQRFILDEGRHTWREETQLLPSMEMRSANPKSQWRFAKSFHFHLRFKGFVNKISHLLYTDKQYKYLLENYLVYFQYANTKRKKK